MQSHHNTPRNHTHKAWRRFLLIVVVFGLLLTAAQPTRADDAGASATNAPQADWLEPRGINVVDLVGLVPEDHLRDTIVTWHVGGGLLQYVSGQRSGNTVTVTVNVFPRYWTDGTNSASIFNCLGKASLADEWTSAVAPSRMRVYENGNDVTAQVMATMDYVPPGQNLPGVGASGWWRYDFAWGQKTVFATDGSIEVPANMGCKFILPGKRTNLTAQFVVQTANFITVEVLGSQDFIFHSYIGVGNAGNVDRLNSQMTSRFGNRHDKFQISPPAGSEYILVKYPPTPVDPYMGFPEINVDQPASGSYRLVGSGNTLSVDHVNTMAMPLAGQWQDADQSGGSYLKFFNNAGRIAVPEYFVPSGVPYNACMKDGGCSNDLLDQIYNTAMPLTIYYYRIGRIAEGLNRIPLKQVGPGWKPGAAAASATGQAAMVDAENRRLANSIFLPIIATAPAAPITPPILEDGDRSGCPCGWFDGYGRMFDYVPEP